MNIKEGSKISQLAYEQRTVAVSIATLVVAYAKHLTAAEKPKGVSVLR